VITGPQKESARSPLPMADLRHEQDAIQTGYGRQSAARPPRSDDGNALIGRVLGSYRILALLGEGGMGRVYEAEHTMLGRKVALKLLRPEYAVRRDAVHRFFQEARAVNTIGHQNIVDVTDFVELETGETFIIMELLRGRDLGDLQRELPMPMPLHRAMQIALQVCDGLEAAHRSGIIHRDLKPDNIFVLNDSARAASVKLLDFGVAKLQGEAAASSSYQTAAGSVIGTPAYMSPEQASGLTVDNRSDIYSLGAILYELFTGHPVFRARSFGEFVIKHMNHAPIPPRELENAPKIPTALERVILRCLEKDPIQRYQSVSELRDDLARATATVETNVDDTRFYETGSGRRRRTKYLLIGAGVVALAAVAFFLAAGITPGELGGKLTDTSGGRGATGSKGSTVAATDQALAEAGLSQAEHNGATQPIVSSPSGSKPGEPKAIAKIMLDSRPAGAEVYREGEPQSLGRTPLILRLTNIGESVRFRFELLGYHPRTETVIVAHNNLVDVPLITNTGDAPRGRRAQRHRRPRSKDGPLARPIVAGTKDGASGTSPAPTVKEKPKARPEQKIGPGEVVDPFK
jgi:serine/threonine-protein kinase